MFLISLLNESKFSDQLVQWPTKAATPIPPQPNAEPLTHDNHFQHDLSDPNALNYSSHRLNNTAAYDSNNLNPNASSGSSDHFPSPLNVDPDNNAILLPPDGAFPLDGSVSPHSNDSGFATPHNLNSPQPSVQLNCPSDLSTIDVASLFQGDSLRDTFGQGLSSSSKQPSSSAVDIKLRSMPNKCALKSASALHVSKISQRKAGRPKLSREEKHAKKKESDRRAAQRYRAKKAAEKKNQEERLARLTKSSENVKGQLLAYRQVVRDSVISNLGVADLDDEKMYLVCSTIVSLCEGM